MILVLNCGSQSIKWRVFDEKLGLVKQGAADVFDAENYKKKLESELKKAQGYSIVLVGHRVVHGGGKFSKPTKITSKVIKILETINHLAPLHNPYNVLGIKACQKMFPGIPQIAVFDTEFFKDLPEKAQTYALPKNIREKFGFKRYGFHGISHEFAAAAATKALADEKRASEKIITVHLGGGASIAAIKNGKAIDTSMGFTPMDGAVMMTRAGNMDLGIVLELAKKYGIEKTSNILNKDSGVKGICGESDMLSVLNMLKTDNPEKRQRAELAFDIFVYSIQKYIGAYYAILGGCDALVFTGSIGSGKEITRNTIVNGLNILKNAKILSIETDEELAIAQKINKIYPQ